MDDLQERYDELDNIEITLNVLLEETTLEDWKETLMSLKFDAQNEKEAIEPRLQAMYDAEDKEREREYWNSQF